MVARDLAPSRAFEMLKSKLEECGVRVAPYLGGGKPISAPGLRLMDVIGSDIVNSRLLLLGMSCTQELSAEEIAAARLAQANGVPFGFYADIFGTSSREWFEPFRNSAKFLFVLSEAEAEATRKNFPKAEVIATGNPVLEGSFWPAKSVEDVRFLLRLNPDDRLMYVTAGKDLEVNRIHFGAVIDAVSTLADCHWWRPVFMLHPGDQNSPAAYEDVVFKNEKVTSKLMPGKLTKELGLAALDVINACDFMAASASTAGVEAACLRKPVADFFSPPGLKRIKEQTGGDTWPPCDFGVSRATHSASELAEAMQSLMSPGGFEEMLERQFEHFPKPAERGQAIRKMTEAVLGFI